MDRKSSLVLLTDYLRRQMMAVGVRPQSDAILGENMPRLAAGSVLSDSAHQ
jgi:hypothetical protein